MDTDDTAGAFLISGFASPDLPSQYVCHILAKQYIFSQYCECKFDVIWYPGLFSWFSAGYELKI